MNVFSINVIDVIIILLILLGGVIGFKRGVFKELVMTVGFYILLFVSFWLKTPVSEWMGTTLPFFKLGGNFADLPVFNLILYDIIAFLLVYVVLAIIYSLILTITKVLEKILDLTIVFGIISKILGFVVGLFEGYLGVFLLCIVFSIPIFNQTVIGESKLKDKILNETPVLSSYTSSLTDTVTEVVDIYHDYDKNNSNDFNLRVIKIMLDNKMVSKDYIIKLQFQNKLNIDGLDELLLKY